MEMAEQGFVSFYTGRVSADFVTNSHADFVPNAFMSRCWTAKLVKVASIACPTPDSVADRTTFFQDSLFDATPL